MYFYESILLFFFIQHREEMCSRKYNRIFIHSDDFFPMYFTQLQLVFFIEAI